jgi:hypothetical protein
LAWLGIGQRMWRLAPRNQRMATNMRMQARTL